MSKGSTIDIKDLVLGYGPDKIVIDGLDLHIDSGENVIIAGPNGSGKTTLLKCILGLVKPLSGTIAVSDRFTGSIAYCGQEKSFSDFPISVTEVLRLAMPSSCKGEEARALITSALESTKCSHLAQRNFFSLSGGEKQRVSIARCLCQDPALILLDEPSSFLDSNGMKELYGILDDLAKSPITILMVSHENSVFEHFGAWRIVRLSDKREAN